MPKTSENQKSTAMDYFSAPRSEGLVTDILSKIGYEAGEGGRLPAGVKYDFIKALDNVLSTEHGEVIKDMVGSETARLQAERKSTAKRIVATPKAILELVKSGDLSLTELQTMLKEANKG